MDNPLFSIIVPVYNVEKCISRCIDSILSQTYENWILILVDDGSPDKSGEICERYSQQDSRIRVYHKSNGGVSSARNYGIEYAEGDAILFVDSDDELLPSYIESFIDSNIDIDHSLIFQGCICYSNKSKREWRCPDRVYEKDSFSDAINDLELFKHGGPYCKLYSLKVIKENRIRFNENLENYEDLIFFLEYITLIDSLIFSSCLGYIYHVQEGGLHLKLSTYSSERLLLDSYINKISVYSDASDNIKAYSLVFLIRVIKSLHREKGVNEIIKVTRDYKKILWYSTKYLSLKSKLLLIIFRLLSFI